MRRIALLAAPLAALVGCELVAGIHDKTVAADPSLPCAQQPTFVFCDDFDSEVEAGDTWGWDTPQGGSSIEMDSTDFKTPPRSAQIIAVPQSPQAQLGLHVGSFSTGFRFAFDLRVDMADLSPIAQVGVAQVLCDSSNTMINYVLGPGNAAAVQVFNTQTQASLLEQTVALPPLRTWTRIVIAYDAAQGLTVLEDGATLLAEPSIALGAPGNTTVILGAVFVNPPGSAPLQMEVDDVVARGQ
jgi:hypothetical protein